MGPHACDFRFGATLGTGAYARVVHGVKKSTGKNYAIKIMDKRFIEKEKKVKCVMMEKKVFNRVSHPHIVKLVCTLPIIIISTLSWSYVQVENC